MANTRQRERCNWLKQLSASLIIHVFTNNSRRRKKEPNVSNVSPRGVLTPHPPTGPNSLQRILSSVLRILWHSFRDSFRVPQDSRPQRKIILPVFNYVLQWRSNVNHSRKILWDSFLDSWARLKTVCNTCDVFEILQDLLWFVSQDSLRFSKILCDSLRFFEILWSFRFWDLIFFC